MAENTSNKSKVPWGILNDVRGLLDVEFDKLGEWLAEKVPTDSFLRKEAFTRIFGVAKQHLERKGNSMGPGAQFFLETLTDIGDYVTAALHGGEKVEPEKQGTKNVYDKATASARAVFITKITDRLEKSDNIEEEAKKIKKELQLFDEIIFGKKEDPATSSVVDDKPKGKGFWETLNEADINAANWLKNLRTEFTKR